MYKFLSYESILFLIAECNNIYITIELSKKEELQMIKIVIYIHLCIILYSNKDA